MKPKKMLFWFIAVCVGILVSACATNSSPGAVLTSEVPVRAADSTQSVQSTVSPVAQATSRGDKLEASLPASVKFGAGVPVLIEFFRFT